MTINKQVDGQDRKVLISTIWIFVVLNYLYCDVLSLMDPVLLKQYMAGSVGGLNVTEGFLFGAAILMEISIVMVLLSRILGYGANRWANLAAGTITTVVQILSLFAGSPPTLYYLFFSLFEVAGTALIVWLAWNWRNAQSESRL